MIDPSKSQVSASEDRPPGNGWSEPAVFEVFDLNNGSFLGRVYGPHHFNFEDARGDEVWGTQIDSVGAKTITRGRLVDRAVR